MMMVNPVLYERMTPVIRIGVVSPALALRAGLRALLTLPSEESQQGPGVIMEISREAASLEEFGDSHEGVDVLVVTDTSGQSETLLRFFATSPGKLALLALVEDGEVIRSLIYLPVRAWGILPLEATAEEMQAAVSALYEGLVVISPAFVVRIFENKISAAGQLLGKPDTTLDLVDPLTERESEVLQWLAQGLSNKQVALALGISEYTVKFHVASIYTKLQVANRTEAVRRGVKSGWITL